MIRNAARWLVWAALAIVAWVWCAVVGDEEEADDGIAFVPPKAVHTTHVRYRFTGRVKPLPLDRDEEVADG